MVQDEKYKAYIKYLQRLNIIGTQEYKRVMEIDRTIKDTWMSREELKKIYPQRTA